MKLRVESKERGSLVFENVLQRTLEVDTRSEREDAACRDEIMRGNSAKVI
jgi:hypothetical protein